MSSVPLESLVESTTFQRLAVFPDTSNHGEIVRTACAFANSEGGEIVIGAMRVLGAAANSRFQVTGIAVDLEEEKKRVGLIGTYLKPQRPLLVQTVPISNDRVLFIIKVPKSEHGTVLKGEDGLAWVRVEEKNEVDLSAKNSRNVRPDVVKKMDSILAEGPSETVELISNPQSATLARTICAFANSKGGTIYLGVNEKLRESLSSARIDAPESLRRVLTGVSPEAIKASLNQLMPRLTPSPVIEQKAFLPSVTQPNYWIIALSVERSIKSLVRLDDSESIYIRVGTQNKEIGPNEIKAILYERSLITASAEVDSLETPDVTNVAKHDSSLNSPDIGDDPVPPNSTDDESSNVDLPPATRWFGASLDIRREATIAEEALNCEKHANVLAAFLTTTSDDVCFGLFGHWGRGKTYLISKVASILQNTFGYGVIRFSAWKYRSTPEVWAHLYETAAFASRSGGRFSRVLAPYRTMLARYGIWPVILGYLWFGFSLFNVNDKLWLGQVALQLLGLTGVAYFLLLFFRLQGFARQHAATMLKQPTYREQLGLQVAIGDDLRALLIGWVPQDYWLPVNRQTQAEKCWPRVKSFLTRCLQQRSRIAGYVLPLLGYSLATIFVFRQLVPNEGKTVNVPFYGRLDGDVPGWGISIVYAVWTLVSLVLPVVALLLSQGPRRLLLIVDDLDRCEPMQMLEIIESVMLLLDDREIQYRLQIAMLVEEDALHAALIRKYSHLRSKSDQAVTFDSSIDDRIVRENLDKIFVSILRLPEIPADDFSELLNKYLHASDGEPEPVGQDVVDSLPSADTALTSKPMPSIAPIESGLDDQVGQTDSGVIDNLQTLHGKGSGSSQEPIKTAIEYAKDLKLSGRERRLLQTRIETLRRSNSGEIRWGPRTVRSYIHKYRLARALWVALHPTIDFDAEAVLNALLPLDQSQSAVIDSRIQHIVSQVI